MYNKEIYITFYKYFQDIIDIYLCNRHVIDYLFNNKIEIVYYDSYKQYISYYIKNRICIQKLLVYEKMLHIYIENEEEISSFISHIDDYISNVKLMTTNYDMEFEEEILQSILSDRELYLFKYYKLYRLYIEYYAKNKMKLSWYKRNIAILSHYIKNEKVINEYHKNIDIYNICNIFHSVINFFIKYEGNILQSIK